MSEFVKLLAGKKTYLLTAVAAVTIIVNHFAGPLPGITLDGSNWLNDLWATAVAATMRAGISKVA